MPTPHLAVRSMLLLLCGVAACGGKESPSSGTTTTGAGAGGSMGAGGESGSSGTLGSGGAGGQMEPPAPVTTLGPCVPSGKGTDYQVGPGAGQIPSLAQVAWDKLGPGDTVRIFPSATPYLGKILIAAHGTAEAPVRVCGVKSESGERPIVDGKDAVARPGLSYTAQSSNNIQETRALVMIDRLGTEDYTTAFPSYVELDGLEIRGAYPGNNFTNTQGAVQTYDTFGACVWIERGNHVTIADNVIHDCTNGVFSRSSDETDAKITRNVRLVGNSIYGNGVAGQGLEHNSYVQSIGVVYEFNHYGPLRAGAGGNAIKDRSVGVVVRYNRIEEGSRALDLVEAEDYPIAAAADPAYHTTFVYGNQIVKSGDTGSFIHYGGDHFGSMPGQTWGEPIFRKGTLYFFYNTVYVTGTGGALFQLSTTEETAEVWDNVLLFAPTEATPHLRMGFQDVNTQYWTPNGVIHLGVNWINKGWVDTDVNHPLGGSVSGAESMIVGDAPPVDPITLAPVAKSAIVGAAKPGPAAADAYPVSYELDAKLVAQARAAAKTLGAIEP